MKTPTTLSELKDYLRTVAIPVNNQDEAERAAKPFVGCGFTNNSEFEASIKWVFVNEDEVVWAEDMSVIRHLKLLKLPELEDLYAEVKENELDQQILDKVFPKSMQEEPQPKEIDWEARRYEIAKAFYAGILSNANMNIQATYEDLASASVVQADALIEELRK